MQNEKNDRADRPTVDELALLASKGTRPAQALTAYEWLFWYECRDIYQDWRNKTGDPDRLKARKEEAVVRYEKAKREKAEISEAANRVADLFRNIEETATAYRKQRSLENADRLMNVVYGLLGGG